LPTPSSGLPASSGGPPSSARADRLLSQRVLLALLQVGFTEPPQSPGVLVVSYTTVSPLPALRRVGAAGGLFSVALSRELPRVGVAHHPAQWSPDLPRYVVAPTQRGRPAGLSAFSVARSESAERSDGRTARARRQHPSEHEARRPTAAVSRPPTRSGPPGWRHRPRRAARGSPHRVAAAWSRTPWPRPPGRARAPIPRSARRAAPRSPRR